MRTQPVANARPLALFSLCLGVAGAFVSPLCLGLTSVFVYQEPCKFIPGYCDWYRSFFLFWLFGSALLIGAASLVTAFVSLRTRHKYYELSLCGALLGAADIGAALLAWYAVTHM
jgi:hypothetical protein